MMRTTPKRSPLASIPGYSQNAVLQLIIASGVGFISYQMTRIIMILAGADPATFGKLFIPNIALSPIEVFTSKIWTLFTYGWTHSGFWELFSNMVWLYAFGAVVQTLIGYKQLVPMFVYCLVVGGLFYELSQLIPGVNASYLIGAQAGVTGFAVAAITLAPSYRFYLGPTFSIPIAVITIIYFVLVIINTNLQASSLLLVSGGGLMGFTYVLLLRNGYQPGIWVYNIFDKLSNWAEPDERTNSVKQGKRRNEVMQGFESKQNAALKKIDDILDKINQKGYNSLTQEEKDILINAGKNNNP